MRFSRYFLPTLKETPAEAQIASHRLMLRAGLIYQTSSGIYAWLPMGLKVLEKIQKIICEELDKMGYHKLLMPTMQSADLWHESGRYDNYGKEMLRAKDRHDRELIYGPTAEDLITDIFRMHVQSYKSLPLNLYNIQWKFRDEIRPRFGVMRGREFLMKDSYSFDLDFEAAKKTYIDYYNTYLKIFKRMDLTAIPVKADAGVIGGDWTHEFHIVAPTGESQIFYDKAFETLSDVDRTYEGTKDLYAAAEEKHDPLACSVAPENLRTERGIEVGQIFYFGSKYSKAMNAVVTDDKGASVPVEMGSYGIGVSRLVGAVIEASHDERGIIWPKALAPFDVGLINVLHDHSNAIQKADALYETLKAKGFDVLYDDRQERAGSKFADMDLIGVPWQIVIGKRTLEGRAKAWHGMI